MNHLQLLGRQLQPGQPNVWSRYFPDEEYSHDDRKALLIREMMAFFASEVGWQLIASGLHHDLCRQIAVLEINLQVLRDR